LEETFTAIPQYNGRIVTDIGELPHPLTSAAKVRGTINARPGSNVVHSELVTEVTVPESRKFLVLAHDGLDVIVKSRPLDVLAELMGQEMQGLLPLLDKWSQRWVSFTEAGSNDKLTSSELAVLNRVRPRFAPLASPSVRCPARLAALTAGSRCHIQPLLVSYLTG
jgi:hypothetical protein